VDAGRVRRNRAADRVEKEQADAAKKKVKKPDSNVLPDSFLPSVDRGKLASAALTGGPYLLGLLALVWGWWRFKRATFTIRYRRIGQRLRAADDRTGTPEISEGGAALGEPQTIGS